MQVKQASRYGVALLLMAGFAQAQDAQGDQVREKLWQEMHRVCSEIPDANLASYHVDSVDFIKQHPETEPRLRERTEFCEKRLPAVRAAAQAAAEKKQADASARAQAHVQAGAGAAFANYKQKRDPSDLVAQVLNYASTGNDNGADGDTNAAGYPHWAFFIKESKCVYRMVDFIKRAEDPLVDKFTVDLSKYDSHLFDFKAIREDYDDGSYVIRNTVLYDGKPLISTTNGVSIERLRRGWNLIYSKYCTGTAKAF